MYAFIAKVIRISRAKFHCNRLKLYKIFKITRVSFFLGHSVDNYSYSGKVGGVMLSFVLSVTSVTYNCRNGRRPNMVGMGKG